MGISRRSFLKFFASIPAVAALPATASLLAQLDAEAAPELKGAWGEIGARGTPGSTGEQGAWLRINGQPVECLSLSVDSPEPTRIEVTRLGEAPSVTDFVYGVIDHNLRAELFYEPAAMGAIDEAFRNGEEALIEASFGDSLMVAKGHFKQVDILVSAHDLMRASIVVALFDVSVGPVGYQEAR